MKRNIVKLLLLLTVLLGINTSCIQPPLHLPGEDVMAYKPEIQVDLNVIWNTDTTWKKKWYYGWDDTDRQLSGEQGYVMPTNYEVRRYYLGTQKETAHTKEGKDAFTVFENSFRRTFQFGYYDLLVWSNIDSSDGTQVLLVDESDIDSVGATTTVTRGIVRSKAESSVVALYNRPEVFYSTYEPGFYISRNTADYDYYDEKENVWVKRMQATLRPMVYIYLVQVILRNNDGRVTGVTGDAALSAMASGTCVNTGHTDNKPCMVYFPVRMKNGISLNGETVDIVGGKLTTFGLCDMAGWQQDSSPLYAGSRTDLDNRLYVTLRFSNGTEQTYDVVVTDQCRTQCYGGVITIDIDCGKLTPPSPDSQDSGNIFVPTVEDYKHVDYDILM